MKRRILFVFSIALLALAPVVSKAQFIRGEIIGGFNTSQVDGDEVFKYKKWGPIAGVGAIIPFNKKWSVSLETLYSSAGASGYRDPRYVPIQELDRKYKLDLDYVEIPFLVHFTDKEIITVGAGFSYSRLVNVDEWEYGNKTDVSIESEDYDINDFRIMLDLRFRIWKQIHGSVRYAYSIDKIYSKEFYDYFNNEYDSARDQYNNVISFRLVWIFNEKIIPKSDLGVE